MPMGWFKWIIRLKKCKDCNFYAVCSCKSKIKIIVSISIKIQALVYTFSVEWRCYFSQY